MTRPMSISEFQTAARERSTKVFAGRPAQPLALLNRNVIANPEPWQALCSGAIRYATACCLQIQRGNGEVNGRNRRFHQMIQWIDDSIEHWNDEARQQYRELRRLLAEIDPECLPQRDEMDRASSAHLDPTFSIA